MTGYFSIDVDFAPAKGSTPEEFDEFLDLVVDELANVGREAEVTATLAALTASFHLPADGATEEMLIAALNDLRTALHAANCGTSGWPTEHRILGTQTVMPDEAPEAAAV